MITTGQSGQGGSGGTTKPVLFGNEIGSGVELQSWVKNEQSQNKIYGLPWDLFPPLNNEEGYHKNIKPIIQSSTVLLEYKQDQDIFGKLYEKFIEKCSIEQLKKVQQFLTSEQYTMRSNIQKQLNGSKIILYSNLVTKEGHNNMEFSIDNNFSTKKPVMENSILTELSSQQTSQLGINLNDILNGIYGTSDFLNKIAEMFTGTQENALQSFMGTTVMLTNLMRMLTREGIKLWESGELIYNTKLKFTFRQVSPEQLDQVYVPLFWLLLQQTPYQKYVGFNGKDQEQLQLTITEKAPPLDVTVSIQNGTYYLEHQQISKINVELYDLKPLPSKQQGIPNGLKGVYSMIPTQQDVTMEIESIIPLQFIVSQLSGDNYKITNKNVYPQLPQDLFK